MRRKNRHWRWNVLIAITLVVCALAFMAHYKNWIRLKEEHFSILSGIYYTKLPYAELDSVLLVEKIPQMERISGFSAWAVEKGVFKDSLNPQNQVYVYVDELRHPKIKLVHHDSLRVYLNVTDSTETLRMYEYLTAQLTAKRKQEVPEN